MLLSLCFVSFYVRLVGWLLTVPDATVDKLCLFLCMFGWLVGWLVTIPKVTVDTVRLFVSTVTSGWLVTIPNATVDKLRWRGMLLTVRQQTVILFIYDMR